MWLFLKVEDVLGTLVDQVVPGLATEQQLHSLEERGGIEIEKLSKCLVVCDEVHDVECMGKELSLVKLTARELLAFQEQAQDPEQLVPDVEVRLLDLVLAILVSALQQLDVLVSHTLDFAGGMRTVCPHRYLILLGDRFLRLHVVQQHVEDLRAALTDML